MASPGDGPRTPGIGGASRSRISRPVAPASQSSASTRSASGSGTSRLSETALTRARPGELERNPGVGRPALEDAEEPALHVLLEVRARPVRLERLLVVVLLVEEEPPRLLPAPVHLVHPAAGFLRGSPRSSG